MGDEGYRQQPPNSMIGGSQGGTHWSSGQRGFPEEAKEEPKVSYLEEATSILVDFFNEAATIEQIMPSLKTLTKVVENLVTDPMEPKFRSLNTTKKAV